jgi:predicted small lipoprotein YifL
MTRALCLAAVAGVLCALLAACGHVGPLEPPGGKGAAAPEQNGNGSAY